MSLHDGCGGEVILVSSPDPARKGSGDETKVIHARITLYNVYVLTIKLEP